MHEAIKLMAKLMVGGCSHLSMHPPPVWISPCIDYDPSKAVSNIMNAFKMNGYCNSLA